MATRLMRIVFVGLIVLVFIVTVAIACGPFLPEAIFVGGTHPDSLSDFAAGRLGIVQPSYSLSYLAVAYRYFSGRTFSASEQAQLVSLWEKYLNPRAEQTTGVIYANTGGGYQSYQNCLGDALRTADKIRAERLQQFGPTSAAFASWSEAQTAVFRNCDSSDSANPVIPTATSGDLPPIIRKDRDYQIAAAYFYAGKWDEAKTRFLAIAEDSSSPWRAIAGLVAARCDIRSASLGPDDPVSRQKGYAAADAQLRKIIADPAFSSVQDGAERLRGFVEFRLDPDARIAELSETIELGTSPETLKDNLDDYTKLLRASRPRTKEDALRQQSAMADWIYAFAMARDTEEDRVSRWQTTKSLPWLVAALTYAQPDTPEVSSLLDAAATLPATSPAYVTVAFHRARLLAAQGKDAQARSDVDEVLKMPSDQLPGSARNVLLALRMHLAANLEEFLRFAPRQPVSIENYAGTNGFVPEFDADAAQVLTQALPTQMLARAAANVSLSSELRRQIAQAAWARALILNQDPRARQLVPVLSSLAPEMAPGLKTYSDAPSFAERRFTAAFLILHEPELHPYVSAGVGRQTPAGEIDNYRDNWWCVLAPPSEPNFTNGRNNSQSFYEMYTRSLGPLRTLYPDGEVTSPQFLGPADRQTAASEWTAIVQSGAAPTWLGQQVVAWAKSHPADPRLPEALHLVVVTTRFGCTDGDSGSYSKQAFTLLHRKYPDTDWAAKTPYWYN
jgi:hypothetical protein